LQQSKQKKAFRIFEPEGFAWNPLPKIAFVGNPMPVGVAERISNEFVDDLQKVWQYCTHIR